MAKSTRVTFELPPASHRVLEQAAQENGINVQAAASLILQAALARRVSGLVPKRPGKAKNGSGSGATAEASAVGDAADPGRSAVPGATAPLGLSEDDGTQ